MISYKRNDSHLKESFTQYEREYKLMRCEATLTHLLIARTRILTYKLMRCEATLTHLLIAKTRILTYKLMRCEATLTRLLIARTGVYHMFTLQYFKTKK